MKHNDETPPEVQLQSVIEGKIIELIAIELKKVPPELVEDICTNMLDDFHWLLWLGQEKAEGKENNE